MASAFVKLNLSELKTLEFPWPSCSLLRELANHSLPPIDWIVFLAFLDGWLVTSSDSNLSLSNEADYLV